MNDSTAEKDLLIIHRCQNRQYNLKKVIDMYARMPGVRNVILDHSSQIYSNISYVETNGFEYYHRKPEVNYFDMTLELLSNTEQEFVVDIPDDDITLKSSLAQSIKFLKQNSDYGSCDGAYLQSRKANDICIKYPKSLSYHNAINARNVDDALERIEMFFVKSYYPLCHAVLRTNIMREIHEMFADNDILRNKINAYDRFFTFLTLLRGKHKILELPFQIRNDNATRRAVNQKVTHKMWSFKNLKQNLSKEAGWLDPLAKKISQEYGIEDINGFQEVNKILQLHFKCDPNPNKKFKSGNIENLISKEVLDATSIMWERNKV